MSKYGPDRDANLGPVQKHVLLVLANRGPSARNDWAAFYPLTDAQVYGAVDGLSRRGLVDAVGFDGRTRLIGLTDRGRYVLSMRSDLGGFDDD